MVYSDDTARRIRLRVKRRTPSVGSAPDAATTQYIRQVAAENPRFTAGEVYAEICYGRRRHDITKDMVRAVLS
jgi:hypothetical protein